MKIVAGLGSIDDYVRFVKAGADEFFCGYVPYAWAKKYGVMLPLNRREVFYYNVQIGSVEELKILKNMVDVYQVPVKITLNSLFYLREQYEMICAMIEECIKVGFDTFIIADPALMLYIKQNKISCKIHLSGELGEVNHKMMEQMVEFPITRYIFHRKNTIDDMKECIKRFPNYEYEAFVLNEMCHFTGGFCNSLHCDELPHLCKVPYQLKRNDNKSQRVLEKLTEENSVTKDRSGYQIGATGCGLCALQQLKEAKVTHLKLVGRGNYADYMEEDIKQLRRAIDLLENSEDYIDEMKKNIVKDDCSHICYYRTT